jgi:hypothetical protein
MIFNIDINSLTQIHTIKIINSMVTIKVLVSNKKSRYTLQNIYNKTSINCFKIIKCKEEAIFQMV